MSSKFITEVKQYADTEDYFIEIPEELCKELGWKEGDTIDWQIDDKGIIISKVNNTMQSKEEPSETYDWYSVKEEAIEEHIKDFDETYDQYIEDTAKETFGQYYHSPEAQGSWNQSIELKKDRVVPSPRNFPYFP